MNAPYTAMPPSQIAGISSGFLQVVRQVVGHMEQPSPDQATSDTPAAIACSTSLGMPRWMAKRPANHRATITARAVKMPCQPS